MMLSSLSSPQLGYRVGLSLPKNAHVYWHDSQAIGKPNALVDGQTPFFDVGKSK